MLNIFLPKSPAIVNELRLIVYNAGQTSQTHAINAKKDTTLTTKEDAPIASQPLLQDIKEIVPYVVYTIMLTKKMDITAPLAHMGVLDATKKILENVKNANRNIH